MTTASVSKQVRVALMLPNLSDLIKEHGEINVKSAMLFYITKYLLLDVSTIRHLCIHNEAVRRLIPTMQAFMDNDGAVAYVSWLIRSYYGSQNVDNVKVVDLDVSLGDDIYILHLFGGR